MNNILRLVICSSICVLLYSIFLAPVAHASDYISNFHKIPATKDMIPQVATWKRTPTVIVCSGAPVKKAQILYAVKFWEDLGYNFFTTQYNYDPLNKCNSKAPVGYIIIHLVTQGLRLDDDDLAQTHFFVNNDHNEVEWAIIYMKQLSVLKETVLEHELGHALGYLHFNKINHLMNSKWMQGGWDTQGLKNKRQ